MRAVTEISKAPETRREGELLTLAQSPGACLAALCCPVRCSNDCKTASQTSPCWLSFRKLDTCTRSACHYHPVRRSQPHGQSPRVLWTNLEYASLMLAAEHVHQVGPSVHPASWFKLSETHSRVLWTVQDCSGLFCSGLSGFCPETCPPDLDQRTCTGRYGIVTCWMAV